MTGTIHTFIKCGLNVLVIVFVQGDSVIQYLEISHTAQSFVTPGNNSIRTNSKRPFPFLCAKPATKK